MQQMSASLQQEYLEKLHDGTNCMLPSSNHTLPTGREYELYLVCDVGGSTFRVAYVSLGERLIEPKVPKVLHLATFPIGDDERQLEGTSFFDWMGGKIAEMVGEWPNYDPEFRTFLSVGLSWSFPIEQTSQKVSTIGPMGKGFTWARSIVGQDISELLTASCAAHSLNVRVEAITNDSIATLLLGARSNPCTSMSLILGTGINMAIRLPTSAVGKSRLAQRGLDQPSPPEMVTVNTEISMFGKDILPRTQWDGVLNRAHILPDFQPLEYMTAGRYLGELFRLVLVEAMATTSFFQGDDPLFLHQPYSVDAKLLALIESDNSCGAIKSAIAVRDTLGLAEIPSRDEMAFLRTVVGAISTRAAAYLATAIHALCAVERTSRQLTSQGAKIIIACHGSVIEEYSSFRKRCQNFINQLIERKSERDTLYGCKVVLQTMQPEAALIGAAIAAAMAISEKGKVPMQR